MELTIEKNLDEATVVVDATFDHPVEKVWELFADPRKLERWWGPPSHPATVVEHSLSEGGVVRYYMTGPEGERYHGRWDVSAVDAPHGFTFTDAFTDEHGTVAEGMPVSTAVITLEATDTGSHLRNATRYPDTAALATVLDMGMEEGVTQAMSQIDAILANA